MTLDELGTTLNKVHVMDFDLLCVVYHQSGHNRGTRKGENS